ncbi:MAG: transposase [Candidatus Methylomirabilis sp.]|nr:transposase [Deltaproteobacteria bacterium]
MNGAPYPRRRDTLRLRGYDYAEPGAYFVTIRCQGRACRFGTILDGEMAANAAGAMVEEAWRELPGVHPAIELDAFVVMPNHVHGVLMLTSSERATKGTSLSSVIQRFKSVTTVRYGRGVKALGWPPFDGRLRRRGFYEHVIRDERDLESIRDYVAGNPAQWARDSENPAARRS